MKTTENYNLAYLLSNEEFNSLHVQKFASQRMNERTNPPQQHNNRSIESGGGAPILLCYTAT